MSGKARVLQQTDPRKCRVLFRGKQTKWCPIWDRNPRIARIGEVGDFQDLHARDQNNLRAYHLQKTDRQWFYNPDFRPDIGEFYFSDFELKYAARTKPGVVIEPHLQAKASPNKQWGFVRWNKLSWLLQEKYGLRVTQLGIPGTQVLDGVEFIETPTFRIAAAVLARAKAAVLPEGGLHHAAAAVGLPAVVIFGGFTPVELTGYSIHRNLGVTFEGACGMRIPCDHCADAMAAIRPDEVAERLMEILNERMARPVPA